MTIDSHYIPAFSIEDVILDKDTGAPLSGGLVYFEQDNQRGVLKPVYQITGTSPNYTYTQLPNPMTLSSIGTFQDSLDNPTVPYFFPYDANFDVELYYVRVTSSEDVPQFTREAVPYVPSGGDSMVTGVIQNELSNPQFAEVLFTSPTTLNFNGVTDEVITIAPNWDVVLTSPGVGSLTLSIITPTGSLNRITNPGTLLNINSSGLTSLKLRQRLYGSPNLWGSGYLSATFIAKTYAGTSSTISLLYSQSNGTVINQVLSTGTLTADGLYRAYPGSALIPASTSTEFFPDAYIDIFFNLPLTTQIDVSSVMVAFTNDVSVDNILYDQESLDRQIDHLFHYYKPQLEFKPIPSFLIGWDFPMNPCQELGTVMAPIVLGGANLSRYIADQTILFSSVDNSIGTGRNTRGFNFSTGVDSSFAIIQYLDGQMVHEILTNRLAVSIQGISNTSIACNINLYWTDDVSLPDVSSPTYHSLVSAVSSSGVQTIGHGTWNKITRENDLGDVAFNLEPSTTQTYNTYTFNGWNDTQNGGITAATYFAIVVSFGTLVAANQIEINYVSLCAGDIATRPAPLSPEQTLSALEYYYETSYNAGITPGTVALGSLVTVLMVYTFAVPPGNTSLYAVPFSLKFRSDKRVAPDFNPYSPDTGLGDTVRGHIYTNAVARNDFDISFSGNWTRVSGEKGIYFIPSAATALGTTASVSAVNPNTTITYQYVADARLGIV